MLQLCTTCNRHARGATCPFCGAALSSDAPSPRARGSRTARFVAVAAIGVACGGTSNPADGGADANEDQSAQPAYGAVIPDASVDASKDAADDAEDASDADASGIALYGAPPPGDS